MTASSRASFDIASLIGARVNGMQEYAPEALEEVALRLGLPVGQLIKLDANENPYGPTPHARAALTGYAHWERYPDAVSRRLREAIGRYIGMDPAQIIVGNGSDELIDLIVRLFRPAPQGGGIGQLINCPPTFSMYQFYGVSNDLEVIEFPRDAEFRLDLAAIEALCERDPRPKLLFLASPNTPDGQILPEDVLRRVLDLPLLVVLDEAYVEFSEGSRVQWVAEHNNLIVLRTFSKWAGLAGLRVGYGVFPNLLMSGLWRLKSPYNVNCAAQAAALATLEELSEAQAVVHKIVVERQRFVEKLREFPFIHPYESQANYVLCRVKGIPVESVRAAMEHRGIILRYFDSPRLADYIRISVGTPMQDESVIVALRTLNQGGSDGR